ncbi:helicase-related protein [Agromyces laixinhei]|uniref:helicase-related protein n=1 Tax=Agromyces laixinhei TaxID=2585717 RepID=UPI001F218131|nr:helicase-related protein [Agromyces laixinhei]
MPSPYASAATAAPEHTAAPELNVAPGSVVVVRDAEWMVTAATQTQDGLLIRAQGLSELVRDTTASFYEHVDDIRVLDPAAARLKADDSPGYRQAKLWLEATLRKTPIPLNEPGLTVSTRMLSDPLGYQQAAVRRALDPQNLRPRILIADAVGLGKTIEIGMILSELVRRGRGERILIVTPKHVLEQMQYEMWTRFALPFVRLDSVGIQRVRQKLPATRNPFSLYKRAIISIDTLKQDKYRAHLRKHKWDAVVIDESHNITGATQNNALARLLARNTEALILASATPHNGKKDSFAELIRLLEPTAVSPDGDIDRDELARLVIRRHRHSPEVAEEVGGDWAERKDLQHFAVPANDVEDAIADELADVWLYPATGSSPYSGDNKGLFPWTLAKAFLSSPAALRETTTERIRRLGSEPTGAQEKEHEALEHLAALAAEAEATGSAKYDRLVAYLREIGIAANGTERAVIFSERVPTLKWLRAKLQKDLKLRADQIEVLHGQLNDQEQQRIVESFKQSSSPIRVLVTGDVASEGVNLHSQCHELIHFDIPWSLIRIEQRNGRVDRYGQRHRPQITTILLTPRNERFAGDVKVLTRLMEREQEAHEALGDVASLMGKYDVAAEEDAIARALAKGVDVDEIVPGIDGLSADADDPWLELLLGVAASESGETAEQDAAGTAGSAAAGASGLFADDEAYLGAALEEVFTTPAAAPGPQGGGVDWRRHPGHGLVEFTPPRDLAQRLGVLPQSYLRDQGVTEHFKLAVTETLAKSVLQQAIDDRSSRSLWPEAHYLGPLHPVLEWVSDRALAKLGRNEVFTVRGDVAFPTVLLIGTLTNRRGHVVASSFLTAAVPDAGDPEFVLVEPHASARDALDELGLLGTLTNPGAVGDIEELQRLIRPAVRHADALMAELAQAAAGDVESNVDRWSQRAQRWEHEADALVQRGDLRQRRLTVEEEQTIAESMKPSRRLVRPLLLVVPNEAGEN